MDDAKPTEFRLGSGRKSTTIIATCKLTRDQLSRPLAGTRHVHTSAQIRDCEGDWQKGSRIWGYDALINKEKMSFVH